MKQSRRNRQIEAQRATSEAPKVSKFAAKRAKQFEALKAAPPTQSYDRSQHAR